MPREKDSDTLTLVWPEIEQSYADEVGFVNPEVYKLAAVMWPLVRTRILRAINDLDAGQMLMMKAVVIVSRRCSEQPEQMTNLSAYLSVVFGRLLSAASRKQGGQHQLDDHVVEGLSSATGPETDIDQAILVRELLQRSDTWTRDVFEHLILGYTFQELAAKFKIKPNRLRSKWSKKIARLKKRIDKESRAAQKRSLRSRS